jgi:hypothetical protein
MLTVNLTIRLRVLLPSDFSVVLRFLRLDIEIYRTPTGPGVIIPADRVTGVATTGGQEHSHLTLRRPDIIPASPTFLRRHGLVSPCQQLGP